jgi:hypothetical protein
MDSIERRISERQAPSYNPEELNSLRISRVHFREEYLFCLLSDGNMVCVPIAISPVLATAEYRVRYQWEIDEDGKALIWRTKGMGVTTERLTLWNILSHPQARITVLPGK